MSLHWFFSVLLIPIGSLRTPVPFLYLLFYPFSILGLLFYPEDGSSRNVRNIDITTSLHFVTPKKFIKAITLLIVLGRCGVRI
jgi:hypothetical protein